MKLRELYRITLLEAYGDKAESLKKKFEKFLNFSETSDIK